MASRLVRTRYASLLAASLWRPPEPSLPCRTARSSLFQLYSLYQPAGRTCSHTNSYPAPKLTLVTTVTRAVHVYHLANVHK